MVSYINTQCDLSHLDPDVNIPLQSNFQYYSVQDFHNNNLIRNCTTSANYFSAMHSNIRSLAANIDNFKEMLCELNHKFSVIALTETKLKLTKITSVILGYQATLSYHNPAYRMLVVLLFMLMEI